jgi:general secretion pathway protein D
MERSKSTISIVVGLAALLIVWRVGFYPEVAKQTEKPGEVEVAVEPNAPAEAKKPVEAKKPGDGKEPTVTFAANRPGGPPNAGRSGRAVAAADSEKPADPNDPMEAVNLKDVQMKDIMKKLADWTGKPIIPSDEAMKQKVTIYAPAKLPRSEALSLIYASLLTKGFVVEHSERSIFIKAIKDAKVGGEVPTIASDYPLALLENKDQVVQKFFKLQNYGASQMAQIVLPLVGEYGYVSADENTSILAVIDTVKSLMRVGLIIEQYDVVAAEEIETEIFEVHQGDPTEIVALLEKLLGSGGDSRSMRGPRGPSPRPGSSSKSGSGTATTVSVGTSRTPAVLIAEPTYNWIIAKATPEDLKQIGVWIEKLDKSVSTVMVDYPLARIEDKNQVVQKVYRLQNYGSSQMAAIVGPLIGESGHLTADENTRTLVVMDTVQNLIRIEGIIEQFDVPEAEQTVTDTFTIYNGDPAEIVQVLRTLLSFDGTGGGSSSRRSSSYSPSRYGGSSYGRSSSYYGMSSSYGRSSSYRSGSSRSSSSPVIGTGQVPIVLIPEPTRKWIIARSSAEDMKKIAEWIEKLDQKEQIEKEYETIPLRYADPSEVADRINEAIQQMPGTELQASVLIQPLTQARQIMVFGREDMRVMVKKLVQEVDIPSGLFETRLFILKHADADKIKENLENLYEQEAGSSYSYSYGMNSSSRRSRNVENSETVRIISFPTLQQLTVIAGPENMDKIAKQIEEWDVPLDLDQVQPRILTLRNSDPVQMADLLTKLFSEQSRSSGRSFFDIMYGNTDDKQKIVGPLFGQLTFEEVPGTKKIIVISNIAGAYDVIEKLVTQLDSQDMAEVPEVITLKYADPEDLSERLNALFVDAGQNAPIRYTAEGLTMESQMEDSEDSGTNNSSNTNTAQQATYTPPWSGQGARGRLDEEMPISNVIGRVRFVPEPHTKSIMVLSPPEIMVLSPPEFMEGIRTMIAQLDVPGKQVVIEAIIVEIEHTKVTSLGVELATNPAAFSSLSENSLTALSNLTHIGSHGPVTGLISPGATNPLGATGSGTVLGIGTDIYALIDFLIKTTEARILNQQTIWTKDNEEASFFKGSEVAFLSSESITNQTATQGIDFKKVGMELMARPSITPEDKVDMLVNVHISQLLEDVVNGQPVRSRMNTTTNMIVADTQTLLLGGILFQKDSVVESKLPLLGDLPLIGGLFRHTSTVRSNSEMLVFITPRVIEESAEELPEATTGPVQKLEEIREELDATMEGLQ